MNSDWGAERRLREQKLKQRHILAERKKIESLTAPKNGQIRKVNFDDFKNHYGHKHHDAPIEVLVAGPDLMSEIREEMDFRRSHSHNTRHGFNQAIFSDEVDAALDNDTSHTQAGDEYETVEVEGDIQRVRIHSLTLLACLTFELNVHSSWYWPRTFFRPFKALVYLQPRLKERLAKWEAQWPRADYDQNVVQSSERKDSEPRNLKVPIKGIPQGDTKDKSPAPSFKSLPLSDNHRLRREDYLGTVEAIDALRVYLEFVDKEIMPLHDRFKDENVKEVAFDDLWSLFRVGELLYVPSQDKSDDCYQELWRLYRVKTSPPVPAERHNVHRKDGGWPRPPKEDADGREIPPPIPRGDGRRRPPPLPRAGPDKLSEQSFTLYCYYIDHDSHALGAVRQKFTIGYFPGERPIDSLAIFPFRYLPDCESKRVSLKAQGQKFMKLLEGASRHQSYSGWTFIRNPPSDEENPWEPEIPIGHNGEPLRHPEFIESDVIVDSAEAFQTVPSWKPEFHKPTTVKPPPTASEEDRLSIGRWDRYSKDVMVFDTPEFIQTIDGIEIRQRNVNLGEDSFLKSRNRSLGPGERRDNTLTDEDFMLLPKRVFAYSLRDRKFVIIDLNFLEDIKHDTEVFRNLQIPDAHKKVVQGLVSSHFEGKELERRLLMHRRESISQDLVQGKGKGLVMLLHGPPGVGKTATAEAVAMENKRPLFVMTCGDLGLTPEEIERSLTRIFRLAHLWDCVLLLDEADVFLTHRFLNDMKRNAMVSVFLRVLEYYNGLLFLTTNRVGTIDEAFKSRVHMSLYYNTLSKEQTREIFRYNLDKLKAIEKQRSQVMNKPELQIQHEEILQFVELHFSESTANEGRWNGRQIRNAFQIASSLAHHDYANQCDRARLNGNQEPVGPVLHSGFFKEVQTATQEFNKYMEETIGHTDAKRAYLQNERSDDFIVSGPQQQSMATQLATAIGTRTTEYSSNGPRYDHHSSANPQPNVASTSPQYAVLGQNPGQTQYHAYSNYPIHSLPLQTQTNAFQPAQSYMTTLMNGGQSIGVQSAQTHFQSPTQPHLYAQPSMQQAQPHPFGHPQTSTSQSMPIFMTAQGLPQGQSGQILSQNQSERQQIPNDVPSTTPSTQPYGLSMTG
ncbi:hypothetical protein PFICI_11387 [Pestalotiopsis fici W106-1]|uniref:AAA+ ATPase domain-containing protein n=1 Tax=Pestalotiopsis fici (strain W106-1 / CGMCC3.15140) TaxID=1229662 RepID=W3WUF4_PESFW|nr:uncharacterized protein PFICI_11387 [Pestalotiopsis fici W106-1]ETS77513.1 hypothetical protein PFICI_11387 [Pestalotiopsis fici W106-1]